MSRLARNPVAIPEGVSVDVQGQHVRVKGKLGELAMDLHDVIGVEVNDNQANVFKRTENQLSKCLWATTHTLVKNMCEGVSEGFTKRLEIQGVGYRANMQGNKLNLALGYSHDVNYDVPQGVKIEVDKQTTIIITGIDKQQVGQVAAEIIAFRPPEPYKGKGIRHEGQYIPLKEGKKK